MATDSWRDAAQAYNLLNESARAEYWRQLTPEQQEALRGALASLQAEAAASPANLARQPAPARGGCGGPLAAGCLGLILGIVLTIGAEIAAVMMGVQAVGDAFNRVSRGGRWNQPYSQPGTDSIPASDDDTRSPTTGSSATAAPRGKPATARWPPPAPPRAETTSSLGT